MQSLVNYSESDSDDDQPSASKVKSPSHRLSASPIAATATATAQGLHSLESAKKREQQTNIDSDDEKLDPNNLDDESDIEDDDDADSLASLNGFDRLRAIDVSEWKINQPPFNGSKTDTQHVSQDSAPLLHQARLASMLAHKRAHSINLFDKLNNIKDLHKPGMMHMIARQSNVEEHASLIDQSRCIDTAFIGIDFARDSFPAIQQQIAEQKRQKQHVDFVEASDQPQSLSDSHASTAVTKPHSSKTTDKALVSNTSTPSARKSRWQPASASAAASATANATATVAASVVSTTEVSIAQAQAKAKATAISLAAKLATSSTQPVIVSKPEPAAVAAPISTLSDAELTAQAIAALTAQANFASHMTTHSDRQPAPALPASHMASGHKRKFQF